MHFATAARRPSRRSICLRPLGRNACLGSSRPSPRAATKSGPACWPRTARHAPNPAAGVPERGFLHRVASATISASFPASDARLWLPIGVLGGRVLAGWPGAHGEGGLALVREDGPLDHRGTPAGATLLDSRAVATLLTVQPAASVPKLAEPAAPTTGISTADAAISAVLGGNADELAALAVFVPVGCAPLDPGSGGPPKCRDGETSGTPIPSLAAAACESYFSRADELDAAFSTGSPRATTPACGWSTTSRRVPRSTAGWPSKPATASPS